MEEQKPRIQSSQPLHHPLAWQPYSENENEPGSLEDDKVVPMQIQNTIAEDELRPHTTSKRKPPSATEGKTRAATGSKKTFKTVRQTQSMQHQYADELQRLEDHAKRLNQIIAEQSNKNAIRETIPAAIADASLPDSAPPTTPKALTPPSERQIAQRSPHTQPIKNQWQSPTPVQEQPIEALKSHEHSIHQRLVELGLYLNEAGALIQSKRVILICNLLSNLPPQHPHWAIHLLKRGKAHPVTLGISSHPILLKLILLKLRTPISGTEKLP